MMKKLMSLLAMLILVVGLAACGGDDNNNNDNNNNNEPQEEQNNNNEEGNENNENNDNNENENNAAEENEDNGSTTGADGEYSDNAKFDEAISLIADSGIEVTSVSKGHDDINGSVDSVMVVLSNEDMLTLEIAEIEPGHENLTLAEEEGEVIINFDGMEGPIPVFAVKGNFVFMFADNHPDYDKVVEVIENEFSAE